MSPNTKPTNYPNSMDTNPKTGRPYGLGQPGQRLDPVMYPYGHTREQVVRSRAAESDRRNKAQDKAAKRLAKKSPPSHGPKPTTFREALGIMAMTGLLGLVAIVAVHREDERRQQQPGTPVTTVAPGIPTQSQLDEKNAQDAQTSKAEHATTSTTTTGSARAVAVTPNDGE